MKLLLLYTYNKGYLSNFFFELSKKLCSDGYSVVNYALKHKAQSFVKDNVTIIIGQKGGYLANYYNIFNVIRSEKPDFILSNFSYVNPALLFGKILGVKKNMVWFHSLNEQMKPIASQVFIKKQFLKLADSVVANSYLTQDELHTIYKIPKKKLEVLPFWTKINEQSAPSEGCKFVKNKSVLNIGCPGRLTAHKNQKILIKALSSLNQSMLNEFHLYFAGKGEDLAELKVLVVKQNMGDKVTFLEHLAAEDMVIFYKEMDLIVLPSLDEAFGLVFIEAIALGVPVLVSSKFGALTFINESEFNLNDFTFNPKSVEDLEHKLLAYFDGLNLPSYYFKRLYEKTFDKASTYNKVKTVLTTIA